MIVRTLGYKIFFILGLLVVLFPVNDNLPPTQAKYIIGNFHAIVDLVLQLVAQYNLVQYHAITIRSHNCPALLPVCPIQEDHAGIVVPALLRKSLFASLDAARVPPGLRISYQMKNNTPISDILIKYTILMLKLKCQTCTELIKTWRNKYDRHKIIILLK